MKVRCTDDAVSLIPESAQDRAYLASSGDHIVFEKCELPLGFNAADAGSVVWVSKRAAADENGGAGG